MNPWVARGLPQMADAWEVKIYRKITSKSNSCRWLDLYSARHGAKCCCVVSAFNYQNDPMKKEERWLTWPRPNEVITGSTEVWSWQWTGQSPWDHEHTLQEKRKLTIWMCNTSYFLEKRWLLVCVPLWKLPHIMEGCPGPQLQGIRMPCWQMFIKCFQHIWTCVHCSESRSCHQGAYRLVLGSANAGSTAKSIIKPGDSQHWAREAGRSSHHVKKMKKGGQGRSRFGGASLKIQNYKQKIKHKTEYLFLNQKLEANI